MPFDTSTAARNARQHARYGVDLETSTAYRTRCRPSAGSHINQFIGPMVCIRFRHDGVAVKARMPMQVARHLCAEIG